MIICIGYLFLFLTCANATYNTYNGEVYKSDLDNIYVQRLYNKNSPKLYIRKREAILSPQNNEQEQNTNLIGNEKSEPEANAPVGLSEGVGANVNQLSNSSILEPVKIQESQLSKTTNITDTKAQNITNPLDSSKG